MKNNLYTIHEMELVYIPKHSLSQKPKLHSSCEVANLLKDLYNPNTIHCQEEFIVLYLSNSNSVIGTQKLSKGGMTSTVVDVRLIMSTALKSLSSGIILSHNHPSGKREPSELDKKLTTKIKEAGKLLDISLLDHVIMTPDNGYFSFADEGLI